MRKTRLATTEETKLWRAAMKDVVPYRVLPSPPSAEAPPVQVEIAEPVVKMPSRKPNGVDGATLKKLTRGEREIEATIDLHGMTLDAAHGALRRFVETQVRADKRCLLVITGKGGPERPGRLKREVPLWLAEWRPPVLAVVPAAPRHGGAGALYVLLQRRR
jgi:DNA-nicking Smr family endonuclease